MSVSELGVVDVAFLVRERWQATKCKGVLIDATTAGAIVAVANALSKENRDRLNAMDPVRAVNICWRLVK